MELKELLKIRLEKKLWLSDNDYDELGLYGEDYCSLQDDYEDEEDEDDW